MDYKFIIHFYNIKKEGVSIFNKNIKYKDIIILGIIVLVGYTLIDNYKVFFDFIREFLSIISPFIYALVFAYCLNPIMSLFENKLKFKRSISILATYTIIIGIIIICGVFLVPTIVNSIGSVIEEVPTYVEKLQGWVSEFYSMPKVSDFINDAGLSTYMSILPSSIGNIASGILEAGLASIFSIASNLIKIIFGILVSIYVLVDKERFIHQGKLLSFMILKKDKGRRFVNIVKVYHKMIGMYIGVKAIDSIIIGLLAFLGLLVLGAPYPYLIAIIVAITNMIPYFGPLVGEVIGVFFGIFVSPAMAIVIFLFLLILQQFDAWYLDPKLVGNKVGVRPFIIILGVIIGGGFFGAVGMLLASPTVATLNIIYTSYMDKYLKNHEYIKEEVYSKYNSEKKKEAGQK